PGGILGRTDDMIVVRGVNVYPSAVEEIIRACGAVAEYQAQVSSNGSLTQLNIQIEPAHEVTDALALAKKLEGAFMGAFALRVPVSIVPAGGLPRFDLKARRWVRISAS